MNSVLKNYLYNALHQLLALFVPLITTPYLTRTLGEEGIGIYSYSLSITNYFMLFILMGLENYGNREIAEHKDDPDDLASTFSSIYYMQLLVGIAVMFIYGIYALFIASDPVIALIFALNVASACFDVGWCLYGLELFKTIAIRNTLIKLVTTVAIFLFIRDSGDVLPYCLIMTACNLLSQLSVWPAILKRVRLVKVPMKKIFCHFKPNLYLFLTVISVGIYKSTDKIMIGIADPSKAQVGFYELSERIIAIPNMLITALGNVMMPRVSNLVAKKDDSYLKLILTSLIIAMALASSMCFGIMAVSREFVPLFYGEGYETCITLYLILLPCSLFMSFANVLRTQYILPNHRDKTLVKVGFYGLALNICINMILIPRMGAAGAAIGTLIAEAFGCCYQSLSVRQFLPLGSYVRYTLPLVGIGAVMFGILYPLTISGSLFIDLVVKIMIGVIVYVCGIVIYFLILKRSKADEAKQICALVDGLLPQKLK